MDSRKYFFYHPSSLVDVCKDGHEPNPDTRFKSLIWDDSIKGITLQQEVFSNGNLNEEKTVRIRVAIFKDEDCAAYQHDVSRFNEWEYKEGQVSESIKMDRSSYRKILDMYSEASRKATEEIPRKIVCKVDVDYSMPVGQEEDKLTLTVPVSSGMLEPGVLYDIGIIEEGEVPVQWKEWACFKFFRLTMPVEEMFIPYSACLKVMTPIGGEICFSKSKDYRHYNGFFSDIHFDPVSDEVEINPALLCFEVEVKCGKDDLPFFNIVLKSGDAVIFNSMCRLLDVEGAERIFAFCPLSMERVHIKQYPEVTASLHVFDREIASFRFFTDRTERGKFRFDRMNK